MVWLLVLALIFALLVAIFALQNATVIGIQFFAWRIDVSLVLVVLMSATVGAVTVGMAALVQRVRLRRQVKHLEGRVRELEQALRAGSSGGASGTIRPPAPDAPPAPRTEEPREAKESHPGGGETL